jgi:hypothetical protein
MKKLTLVLVVTILIAAAGTAWWLGLFTFETHSGYFGPAFSRDGRHVYVVVRESSGLTWGLGWEHFTSPAHAYPLSDRVSLVRIDVASGALEVLEKWPATPVTRRVIREYRGRVFNPLVASLRPSPGGNVDYELNMAIPIVPRSEIHVVSGTWSSDASARRRGDWVHDAAARLGPSEPVLAGQIEVFTAKGPELFPSAVVLLDHRSMSARVIAQSPAYAESHPRGVQVAELMERSRKKDLDRTAELQRIERELVSGYRAQGMSEIEALLRSSRDLQDLGYLPRSTRIVAYPLARATRDTLGSLPLFEIADGEMISGVFPDIDQALAAPGAEVDKSMGQYLVHRDYGNSAKLNAYLGGGGREFLVRFRGRTYRIEVRPGN